MTKIQKMYKILSFYQDYYGYTKKDFEFYLAPSFFKFVFDNLKEGGELEINLNKLMR